MAQASDLSVVVVSRVGGEALARCIERLPATEVEVVVVLRDASTDAALWSRRYPRVRFLPGAAETVERRRKRGIDATGGVLVALVEDTSWPERGWCDAIRAAFADPGVAAAAGPVAIARFLSDRSRAAAWIAYGAFAPGTAFAGRLPGNAMAFRRNALLSAMAGEDALDEDAVCRRLGERGGKVVLGDGMTVTYSASEPGIDGLAAFGTRGRRSGAARPARTLGQRLRARSGAAGVALSRTARDIRRARRDNRQSVTILFVLWLALLETAWAFGAASGSVAAGRLLPSTAG